MILSNVNIGSGPSAGDGDPLRSAFNTINENFEKIESNVNLLTNSVSSVAGRTGNVTLTVLDIVGINNYATTTYVANEIANVSGGGTTYSNTNVAAYLPGYSGSIQSLTTANTNMKGYVDASITANITALIDTAPLALDTLNELAAAIGDDASFASNILANLATLTANAGAQAGQISTVSTSVTTANTNMKGYVDSEITTVSNSVTTANTNMKGYVDSVANASSYSNVNVAAYLPTYTGNVGVGSLTFTDLSVQTSAYTGQQWRTNLTSILTTKPSWMSYFPDGSKPTLDTNFGFDSGGMWFSGNANDQHAYPIRTNIHFHDTDVVEIVATFDFNQISDDHGLAIFLSSTTEPFWRFSPEPTRIAFQYSVATPELRGQTTSSVAGSTVLTTGNTYTIKFVYNPTAVSNNVTVYTYDGANTSGTLLDTRTITETLPAGDFVVGFDADQDQAGQKSYFTNLSIRTLTNAVFNDVEVVNNLTVNQIAGNLIPSANVTYSLGNETHQWKELWVSGNTIHIGGAQLSVSGGAIQSSLPIAANVTATNITVQGTRIEFASGGYIEESEVFDGNANPLGYYGIALNSSDDGVISMNALDSNAAITSSVFVTNVAVQINVANITPGESARVWYFDNTGGVTFPDTTTQSTAWTGFTANAANWDGTAPITLDEAIDRLAILLKSLNSGTGA